MGLQLTGTKRLYQRAVRWFLDFPILHKILVANSALAVAATVMGAILGSRHVLITADHRVDWGFALWFGLAALAVVILVNYALIRVAHQPFSILTQLIAELRQGDMNARAKRPLFGDRHSTLLIEMANGLLDDLAAYRRRIDAMSERVAVQLESERKNIARELHDDTAQNLVTLLVLEQMIARASNGDERKRVIEEARQLTRLTLEGVRRLSIGLRPDILDDVGLQEALRWYVEKLAHTVLPEVDLNLDDTLDRLPSVAELALYRIAQEALSNVARHAKASKVTVWCEAREEKRCSVEIRMARWLQP